MLLYELISIFAEIGFFTCFLLNSILIYLTVYQIQKLTETYKILIIVFSIGGLIFTATDVITRTFSHNINNALCYFSLNQCNFLSQDLLTFLISAWAGFYIQIIAFVSVLFIYRYLCLFDAKKTKRFDGWGSLILVGFPMLIGVFYVWFLYFSLLPVEAEDDERFSLIMLQKYNLLISKVPRLMIIPYNHEGRIRWKHFIFLAVGGSLITLLYSIMLYCGVKMHRGMQKELSKFSASHRKLQIQFFKALIAQSIGPTLFLVLPIAPILLSPLIPPCLKIEINWQTGWFFSLIGVYSPFDSVAFMWIVTEYKSVIQKRFLSRFWKQSATTTAVHAWTASSSNNI